MQVIEMEPPYYYPPILVAGNYENEGNDDITCPLCNAPSGWNRLLWIDNIPEIGLYCNNCHNTFYEGDFYNG